MIIWHERIYMDETVKKKPMKYKRAVEKGKLRLSLYCITFPSNEENLFDIYQVNEFRFSHYKRNDITVVGLATSKQAAFELVKEIFLEVYEKTGDTDVRAYFGTKQ